MVLSRPETEGGRDPRPDSVLEGRGGSRGLIEALELAPHPEGGWYRETWRAAAKPGERAAATAILFLLEGHQRSHWHRVDASEVWLWHAGDPLLLSVCDDEARPFLEVILGPDVHEGQLPQSVIAPGAWQAASPLAGTDGYTLVSCVVAPAFEFAGFELAPEGWRPGG